MDLLNVQLNILAANRLLLCQPFRGAHGALVFNETVTLSELVSSKHLEAAVGVVLKIKHLHVEYEMPGYSALSSAIIR